MSAAFGWGSNMSFRRCKKGMAALSSPLQPQVSAETPICRLMSPANTRLSDSYVPFAHECASMGIRVNTVNPGATETRMMRSIEEQFSPEDREAHKRKAEQWVAMHHYATPHDIAQMMLFLASDESRHCTGSIYMVDGGQPKRC